MPDWGVSITSMPWLKWLKWIKPKQLAIALLRDDIDAEINQRTEAHRKRIEELGQWNETNKERIEEINKLDIEKITKRAEQAVALSKERVKVFQEEMIHYVKLYGKAVGVLAMMAHTYPVDWEYHSRNLDPEVSHLVDDVKATFPPPSPPPEGLGLGLGGLLDALPPPNPFLSPTGSLTEYIKKAEKDKDPSKR